MGLTISEFLDYYWNYICPETIINNVESDVESEDSERETDYDEDDLKYMQ